jgi:hypothetical protein
MKNFLSGFAAAVVLSAVAAAPALADRVTVRIEGDAVSLMKTVDVPTTGTFGPDNCPYDTAGGAIEIATEGNWDRSQYAQTILGETHQYNERDWWNYWLNREWSSKGICDASQPIQDGDEILMIVQRDDANFNPTVFPLFMTGPSSVERGQEARFTVTEHVYSYSTSTTTRGPSSGATVAGGGASAVTGDDGTATLTFSQSGTFEMRATRTSRARSNPVVVVVTEPDEPPPPPPPPPEEQGPACATNGADGRCGTPDRQAPTALIQSIREGAVFRRGRGPRVLGGTVGILGASRLLPDGSGIASVKLKLTRRVGPRCWTWSPSKERFVRRPCGAANGFWFDIGSATDWEYLLPARLGRGRYVLDADAIDRAGNRQVERRRGENRVVFHVR